MTMQLTNGARTAEAIRLVRARRSWHPAEVRVIVGAADDLEKRGEPYSRDENRVIDIAENLRVPLPEPKKRPASPWAVMKAGLQADLVEKEKPLHGTLELIESIRREIRKTRIARDVERLNLELREAKTAREDAHRAWLRVRSRLTALELMEDRWVQDMAARYHGCTCKHCTGTEPVVPRPRDCIGA